MANSGSIDMIEDFLAQKRIAMVGVSRFPQDFSRMLFDEFRKRGYDMVPVNPNAWELSGTRCYAQLRDILPPVNAAILMTSVAATEDAVHDCAEAGVHRVWLYGTGGGERTVSARALESCRAKGMKVVAGHCPYMFWREAHWGHHAHGFFLKVFGQYPRHGQAKAA